MNSRMRTLFIFFTFALFTTATLGQDVLMTIAGKDVTVEEFERIYKKNNNSLNTNQQTPEDYAELFINFKLKVAEAENLGMDTLKSFLKEFNKYKEQLAEPYMTDDETREELMREAYERSLYDIHVSHILINLNQKGSPEDTLATYEKAMEIRQRVVNGEDFSTVARATSDDPSAKTNGGDLGYFTVFTMLYKFESKAYNMEPGDISMPIRTRFGYHILKLHEKRPAVGQVKVAQIFVRSPEEFSAEETRVAKE
jgi:peptidyl-prolyl cis-trans isomerase SurA